MPPREFARHLRVAAELQRVLNGLLQVEVKDPRLRDVRVSEVELSGDLGVARVFYSTLDPDADTAPITEGLSKAAPFIRRRVGQEVKLRRVPELRFEHDESARRGLELTELIRSSRPSPGPDDQSEE
jgi:ribosome-binding factor A